MLIFAHRGLHKDLPENSMAAFEAAIQAGADGIEFDVRLSRDGIAMVTHDIECASYLDGVDGYVFERTAGELRSVPLRGSPPRAPQFMPTLDEVLDTLAPGTRLEVELKDPSPALVKVAARSLERHRPHWDAIEVTSFEPALLAAMSRELPGIHTCVLIPKSEPWMKPRVLAYLASGKAQLAGARAVHLHPTQLDALVIAHLRARDVEVHTWDVNDADAFQRVAGLGITRCDTDQVDAMLDLARARTL